MSELDELKEATEHALHNPSLVPVSFTMAILAVLVAISTLLGHRAHTEELLLQTRAADTWAEYQAKNIRANMHVLMIGILDSQPPTDRTAKLEQDWTSKAAKLNGDKTPLLDEAHRLEAESHSAQRRGDRFDLSEALLETALVITSITLLTRNRLFWFGGLALAAAAILGLTLLR